MCAARGRTRDQVAASGPAAERPDDRTGDPGNIERLLETRAAAVAEFQEQTPELLRYVRFVYDGDASDTASLASTGSGVVEDVVNDYFASQGLPTAPTAFDGRSDYDAFISVGIPAGGLFTGAEGVKTAEQAAIYGGTAGLAYDPCYQQACDTIANLNNQALDEMSDAAAHATVSFALTSSAVEGTDKGRALGHGDYKGAQLRK